MWYSSDADGALAPSLQNQILPFLRQRRRLRADPA
jgi:hypothetical protein